MKGGGGGLKKTHSKAPPAPPPPPPPPPPKKQASPQSLPRLASPEYCTWTTDLQLSVSLSKVKFCKNDVLYFTDLSNTRNIGKTKRVDRRSQGYKLRVISIKFLLLISMLHKIEWSRE